MWASLLGTTVALAGAKDRLEFDTFLGEHSFSGKKAFSFFDKYLKEDV